MVWSYVVHIWWYVIHYIVICDVYDNIMRFVVCWLSVCLCLSVLMPVCRCLLERFSWPVYCHNVFIIHATRDAPGGLVGAVSLLLVLLVLLCNTIQMVSHRVVQKCSVREYDETHPCLHLRAWILAGRLLQKTSNTHMIKATNATTFFRFFFWAHVQGSNNYLFEVNMQSGDKYRYAPRSLASF